MKPDRVDVNDSYPEYLSKPFEDETKAIGEYLGKNWKTDPKYASVMLVYSKPIRLDHTWSAIAIQYADMSKDDLIAEIVSLRADEYHGKIKGHYVFWWD